MDPTVDYAAAYELARGDAEAVELSAQEDRAAALERGIRAARRIHAAARTIRGMAEPPLVGGASRDAGALLRVARRAIIDAKGVASVSEGPVARAGVAQILAAFRAWTRADFDSGRVWARGIWEVCAALELGAAQAGDALRAELAGLERGSSGRSTPSLLLSPLASSFDPRAPPVAAQPPPVATRPAPPTPVATRPAPPTPVATLLFQSRAVFADFRVGPAGTMVHTILQQRAGTTTAPVAPSVQTPRAPRNDGRADNRPGRGGASPDLAGGARGVRGRGAAGAQRRGDQRRGPQDR